MDYYTLDRIQTAKMLNISTRTLDRYIAKKIFSTVKKKGKIFFHSKEIEDFLREKNTESIDINIDNKFKNFRQNDNTENQLKDFNIPQNNLAKPVSTLEEINNNEVVFKKMYETMHQLFKSQQEQLTKAYFRIGQLETKQQLLEQNNLKKEQEDKFVEKSQKLQNELFLIKEQNYALSKNLENLKRNKHIYLIIAVLFVFFISLFFIL